MKQEEKKEVIILDPLVNMVIPRCCREGWKDCPHVINKPKQKKKVNIGL
jgi:hypothetical protein